MEYSQYIVNEQGKLLYSPDPRRCSHTVWGIAKHGLIHGAGAYLKRDGKDVFIFDKPDNLEIQRYYDNL